MEEMTSKAQLLSKVETHQAVVAIIGLGYVGLPLAVAFAEKGFPVVGIDTDARKVDSLNQSISYVIDIPSARLMALPTGRFTPRLTTRRLRYATRPSFACRRR